LAPCRAIAERAREDGKEQATSHYRPLNSGRELDHLGVDDLVPALGMSPPTSAGSRASITTRFGPRRPLGRISIGRVVVTVMGTRWAGAVTQVLPDRVRRRSGPTALSAGRSVLRAAFSPLGSLALVGVRCSDHVAVG
jgi:hypothetical protein